MPGPSSCGHYGGRVRVLLVSTYELGHQPLHLASAAGTLERAGHEVRCLDLAVEPYDEQQVRWADAVAFSVPMHTAFRIALGACRKVKASMPEKPLCMYGLYAHVAETAGIGRLVDICISGEYETPLLDWVDALESGAGLSAQIGDGPRCTVDLRRGQFGLPARHLLPPLDRYARLAAFGELRLAGYVEASHGCSHRCRHCPVPVIYDGRTRLVGAEAVVADVSQLVDLGARHITFGDPDFLNGPHHATRTVQAVHSSFPDLTFDVTAKVEHILEQAELWPKMAASGCVFVVSAFESTSETVLTHLRKGHSAADEPEAVALLRACGIEARPSLLPFTPWTTAPDVLDIMELIEECDLIGNVDPVQLSIRLLLPPGSLLLSSGALDGLLGPYDEEHLSWTWRSGDARLDTLSQRLASIAERASDEGWPSQVAHSAARSETVGQLAKGRLARPKDAQARLRSPLAPDERPRLTESWFCCAEPTETQLGRADEMAGATAR